MVVEDMMIRVLKGGNESSREPKNDVSERPSNRFQVLFAHKWGHAFRKSTEALMTPHRVGVSVLICSLRSWLRA